MTIVDTQYLNIVGDILKNNKFNQIKNIKHHNSNRLDHSLKVSYYSYKITKLLRLNYESSARGGLLHDFYLNRTVDFNKPKEKFLLYTTKHPKEALNNSKELFDLTSMEEDMIRSHMFPFDYKIPKYLESWIVCTVDSVISTYELSFKFFYKFSIVVNLFIIYLMSANK